MADLTWMMLKDKLAAPDADIFGEDTGGFVPMGDAVKSILAAASGDSEDFGFGSFFGGLTDPVERQQYFATLAQAASQAPDASQRNKIYEAAKQFQTANLGDQGDNRPQRQHAMHQMLLQAMANRGQMAPGPGPQPTGPGVGGQQLPSGSIGQALSAIEQAQKEKEEALRALGYTQ